MPPKHYYFYSLILLTVMCGKINGSVDKDLEIKTETLLDPKMKAEIKAKARMVQEKKMTQETMQISHQDFEAQMDKDFDTIFGTKTMQISGLKMEMNPKMKAILNSKIKAKIDGSVDKNLDPKMKTKKKTKKISTFVDPEADMTTFQIIKRWGYPAEEYSVLTNDGYFLDLHRIPYGKSQSPSSNRPIIFLQHGLEDSSFSWVANLPSQSAGFIFADAGFDVWMGNMRGNVYSRDHIDKNVETGAFWDFTFTEMAQYDLPAMLNGILKYTNQSSLYYAGHSQGTLTMFSLLSRDNTFHTKIRQFFALAPIGHVKYINGLMYYVANYFYDEIYGYYALFGNREFAPSNKIFQWALEYFCDGDTGNMLCDNFVMLVMGTSSDQLNATRTPVYMPHLPGGTSIKNILHWGQMARSEVLCEWDYGLSWLNDYYYGTDTPPQFYLQFVNAPVHLFWSYSDWLADGQDIEEYLIPTLGKSVVANHKLVDFNHIDFLWGLRAAKEVYQPMLNAMRLDLKNRKEPQN